MATDIPEKTRKEVYARDGYRCRWCGRGNAWIHLHHIVYRSSGVDHSKENLISLCEAHHRLVHTNKHVYQPVLLKLIKREPGITGIQLMRWEHASQAGEARRASETQTRVHTVDTARVRELARSLGQRRRGTPREPILLHGQRRVDQDPTSAV